MPNLDALDTAIAIVIVLLLLSLIVQSVQSLLKKLLKIKSRQLEQSLVDLFQNVTARSTQESSQALDQKNAAGNKLNGTFLKSPLLQLLTPGARHPADQAGGEVRELYGAVMTRFKEIGRVSAAGKHMLDSISKEDLLKVVGSVGPNTLLPKLLTQLSEVSAEVNALSDALERIDITHLDGEASAKFAAMHEALAPVLSDMQSFMSGRDLKPELVLGDVMHLRQINLADVLKLLGEVQTKVERDLEVESTKPGSGTRVPGLTAAAEGLRTITKEIIAVRQKFDAAVAPLRTKLNEVEVWYDTVMHSFEERYARSMKTWAVAISFVVVIILNANFFNIYRNIAANDLARNIIVQASPEVLTRSDPATPSTSEETKNESAAELAASLKSIREQLKKDVDLYASLGFAPLQWAEVRHWASTLPPSNQNWLMNRKQDLRTLLGWSITALLLSVGAPFWQDTLESLFGLKSLLRKRGDIKNVEEKSGAGNPKS
jgi:hypothetical protein